ncbi:MAG: lysylphosphatidylglycerol synthase domain-containing protein, partial [Bdellovibrionia bacterium]
MYEKKWKVAGSLLVSGISLAFVFSMRSINLEGLGLLLRSPSFWAAVLAAHQTATFLTAVRWRILISRAGHPVPELRRLFFVSWAAQTAGLFPGGSLFTDASKLGYMAKGLDMPVSDSARTILADRLYALGALFLILCFLTLLLHAGPLVLLTLAGLLALSKQTRVLLGLSAAVHLIKAALILFAIQGMPEPSGHFALESLQRTFVGLTAEAIPISWNGLGIGHLAFEFQAPGRGAEVYNAFFLAKIVTMILGIFPLLWLLYS